MYNFISHSQHRKYLLEVGCGCGVIGLLLKRDFDRVELHMLDIQKINAKICTKNAKFNGLECKITRGDFRNFKSEMKFDLIFANPPFYHSGIKKSTNPHIAISRYSENLDLWDFVKVANSHLSSKGELIFCFDAKQIDMVIACLKEFKLNLCKVQFIHPNRQKPANLVLVQAKKSSKSMCDVLSPIFINKTKGGYTKKALEIFKKANLQSIDIDEISEFESEFSFDKEFEFVEILGEKNKYE
ncbi:MAG: methyltransferase [Campylobacter sp.]|nr:methyltransferase [Campylobacter sp.]